MSFSRAIAPFLSPALRISSSASPQYQPIIALAGKAGAFERLNDFCLPLWIERNEWAVYHGLMHDGIHTPDLSRQPSHHVLFNPVRPVPVLEPGEPCLIEFRIQTDRVFVITEALKYGMPVWRGNDPCELAPGRCGGDRKMDIGELASPLGGKEH